MSYPFVPLQHSAIHENNPPPEDLRDEVLRNRDLLAQILAGGENARVTMKELCALVQNFCSAGMCTEDQWKGVQDAMKIP